MEHRPHDTLAKIVIRVLAPQREQVAEAELRMPVDAHTAWLHVAGTSAWVKEALEPSRSAPSRSSFKTGTERLSLLPSHPTGTHG